MSRLAAMETFVRVVETGSLGAEWRFRQGDVEIPVTLKGRVRVNAAEGVREAVFAGLGIAVASEWMFAPELRKRLVAGIRLRGC